MRQFNRVVAIGGRPKDCKGTRGPSTFPWFVVEGAHRVVPVGGVFLGLAEAKAKSVR